MHFAFVTTDTKGIEQFEHLMSRFAKQELPGGQLNQAQWMYFVTRYLALKTEFNYPLNQSDSYLLQRTAAWLHNRWMFEPAYQWGQLPLIGTKSRMKLIYSSSKAWPLSYYPIILDYELFYSLQRLILNLSRKNIQKLSSFIRKRLIVALKRLPQKVLLLYVIVERLLAMEGGYFKWACGLIIQTTDLLDSQESKRI